MWWWRWFPWKALLSRFAKVKGFIDPVSLMARMQRFAQPSEVEAPIELLRAGVVFHARGLINTRAIQHNLDWVWPYWVERQFNPLADAFVPRGFSITHVNLTHRNWTALGVPDLGEFPIIDPRGLVTPFFDGWSLDVWIVTDDGRELIPSRHDDTVQRLICDRDALMVETETVFNGLSLTATALVAVENGKPVCRLTARPAVDRPGWVVITLRPYNPEGVSFVHSVRLQDERTRWHVNQEAFVRFASPVDRHVLSNYQEGDVYRRLLIGEEATKITCKIGMATGAALFRVQRGDNAAFTVNIDLHKNQRAGQVGVSPAGNWTRALGRAPRLHVCDEKIMFLYEGALRTLVLHTPDDVYAGPYTYKRFWFRDAVFIVHGLLCLGLIERAERALNGFFKRQKRSGFFYSQEGEWDTNGEVLWVLRRFHELTDLEVRDAWRDGIVRGAEWIVRKRLPDDLAVPHAGLLPAGFSAEHFGANDYYYWDDFWSVAGLRAAAVLCHGWKPRTADRFRREAERLTEAINGSLHHAGIGPTDPVPASPYRRVDTSAIGVLAAGYPLSLWSPDDPRILATARVLLDRWSIHGAYFHDTVHSGINIYLTLHIAQVLLRAGDMRFFALVQAVADLASPTGQWPEAIHPRTGGGCMGDGQHAWAAAEWVVMLRNMFVREEGDILILASGITPKWLKPGHACSFGPSPTAWGLLTVHLKVRKKEVAVGWDACWLRQKPRMEIRLPNAAPMAVTNPAMAGEVRVPYPERGMTT